MAVLEHQSDSLPPCLLVLSLGHDLSFPQKEVWIMPGVVQSFGTRPVSRDGVRRVVASNSN